MESTVNGCIYSTPAVVKHRVTLRIPLKPFTKIACITDHVKFPNAELHLKLCHFTTRN